MFERTALAVFEGRDQTVDLGSFRFSRERAIRLQASDQDGKIARFARRVADALNEAQISAAVRDERADVFERSAQAPCSGPQIVQRLAVESALVNAPVPRVKRRDALLDQAAGPVVEYSRGLSPENVWGASYRTCGA